MNMVNKIIYLNLSFLKGSAMAPIKPLVSDILMAISAIINRTNGSKILKLVTTFPKRYFIQSTVKIFLIITKDVSKVPLTIAVFCPSKSNHDKIALLIITIIVKIINIITGPKNNLFFSFFTDILPNKLILSLVIY